MNTYQGYVINITPLDLSPVSLLLRLKGIRRVMKMGIELSMLYTLHFNRNIQAWQMKVEEQLLTIMIYIKL
jgi:hypothetical protein